MSEIAPQSASKLDERLPLILLPLLAFGITLPLILHGCSCGHDFSFHLVSWYDATLQLKRGVLWPHWAYSPAWNAGEPRFIFYPPISWVLGELLALIHWTSAYIVYLILALSAAGLAFHRLARAFAAPNPALLASALYMLNPYMLFTVYERAAFAELLSAAWLCLLLHALLRDRPTVPSIAIPIALLWLTDAPAAVIGCYTLVALTAIRFLFLWITTRRAPRQLLRPITSGALLGLGLAACYIVPATWERHWVQIGYALTPTRLPQNNFLFGHLGDLDHDTILRAASIVALEVLIFTLAVLVAIWFTRSRAAIAPSAPAFLFPTLALLTLLVIFLLTPASAFVWFIVPQLNYLQFPWRFLLLLGPIAALALAILLSRAPLRTVRTGIIVALLAFILIPVSIHAFRQLCDPEETPAGVRNSLTHRLGVDRTDEYTPNGASNVALQPGSPAYWLATDPDDPPDESDDDSSPPLPFDFLVNSPQKQFLILNLRDYPAWRLRVNGYLLGQPDHRHRDDGRIAVPIIAGVSAVNISYAVTPDITFGRVLSCLALLRLLLLLGRTRLSSSKQNPDTELLGIA